MEWWDIMFLVVSGNFVTNISYLRLNDLKVSTDNLTQQIDSKMYACNMPGTRNMTEFLLEEHRKLKIRHHGLHFEHAYDHSLMIVLIQILTFLLTSQSLTSKPAKDKERAVCAMRRHSVSRKKLRPRRGIPL